MSIISANPHPNRSLTVGARVRRAREALFGEKKPVGRTVEDDELILFSIVSELNKSEIDNFRRAVLSGLEGHARTEMISEIERDPKSARAVVLEQVPNVRNSANREAENIAKRLQRKAAKAEFTSHDMADLEGLIHGDSARARTIREILNGLEQLGINIDSEMGRNITN